VCTTGSDEALVLSVRGWTASSWRECRSERREAALPMRLRILLIVRDAAAYVKAYLGVIVVRERRKKFVK
jgi:hypothetical protein